MTCTDIAFYKKKENGVQHNIALFYFMHYNKIIFLLMVFLDGFQHRVDPCSIKQNRKIINKDNYKINNKNKQPKNH